MYQRILKPSKASSFFLFGARATGKTQLLKHLFSEQEAFFIDLLDPDLSNRLMAYPNDFKAMISPFQGKKQWIVVDEVQKIPALLNIVHQQISAKAFKFALTGSSARQLKRGSANLLAGRAFLYHLFPLSFKELGKSFDLDMYLSFGGLPDIYNLNNDLDRKRLLKAYCQTYLKEEIIAEQIIRNLPPFRRFLDIVGKHNSEIINFSNIAKDIASDPKTVSRYFDILEDTLLGFYLPSYSRSIRKQQKKSKKFYFFDTGWVRTLCGHLDLTLKAETYEYGRLFESFIINEIHKSLHYHEKQFKLSFLRVSDTQEIDLIVELADKTFVCEIKSTQHVSERHCKTLNTLAKEFDAPQLLLISKDLQKKKIGQTLCLPWRDAIAEICC